MPEHDGLMRIFWPLDIPRTDTPGIIVGWRNSGLDVFIVAILEDVEVSRTLEHTLVLLMQAGQERGKRFESWNLVPELYPSY